MLCRTARQFFSFTVAQRRRGGDRVAHPARHAGSAAQTNKVFYTNPNAASLKFVKKDVAENTTIFLSKADQQRVTPPDAAPQDIRRVQTRIFTSFKAGK